MYTTYRMNADELSVEFLTALQALFKHKEIEISVCETEAMDETSYLLANPANRKHLLDAVDNIANNRNLVTVGLASLA